MNSFYGDDVVNFRIAKAQKPNNIIVYYVLKFNFDIPQWFVPLYCDPEIGFNSLEQAFDAVVKHELKISQVEGGVVIC